jgi:hypothetical protein
MAIETPLKIDDFIRTKVTTIHLNWFFVANLD